MRTRSALLSAALLAALLSPRLVGAAALYLDWDECGPTGAQVHASACDVNTGSQQLYCAFSLDQPLDQVLGVEIVIDVQHSDPTLPPWWQMGSGGCRDGALTADGGTPAGTGCTDFWQGKWVGGQQGFAVGQPHGGPSQIRIKVALSLLPADARTLAASTLYYGARIVISNQLTTGTGSCGGCASPACLVMNSILIKRLPGALGADLFFETPAPGDGNIALWQGVGADCQAVPVKHRTWGAIKSLYR